MSESTSIRLDGDVGAIRAAADWADRVRIALEQVADDAYRARDTLNGGWGGAVGDLARGRMSQLGGNADVPRERIIALVTALHHLADELSGVHTQFEEAKSFARRTGLVVTGDAIQKPGSAQPDPARDRAFTEVCALVKAGREREDRAHRSLQTILRPPETQCREEAGKTPWSQLSGSTLASFALDTRKSELTTKLGHAAAVDRHLAQAAATVARAEQGSSNLSVLALQRALQYNNGFLLKSTTGKALTAGTPLPSIPDAKIKGGLRTVKVPYVSWVFTGLSIQEDMAQGDSFGDSTIKEVGGTAAGALASAGVLAGGVTVTVAGVTAAPVVVAAAVGAGVAMGVTAGIDWLQHRND